MAAVDSFDVVIVGAGAAGCVVARRVADAIDGSVVLLEAGPDLGHDVSAPLRDGWSNPTGGEWSTDWGYASEPDAGVAAGTPLRRGRLLGGTSWLTRFAVRGAAADFDAWAARGNPGWDYASVLPAFRRLEADAEFGDRDGHGTDGPMPITRRCGAGGRGARGGGRGRPSGPVSAARSARSLVQRPRLGSKPGDARPRRPVTIMIAEHLAGALAAAASR